jgi:hypothetical protein
MKKAVVGLPKQTAGQCANFIGARTNSQRWDNRDPSWECCRYLPMFSETWRGFFNRLGGGDPIAYNLNLDGGLRNLPFYGRSARAKQAERAARLAISFEF